VFTSAGALPKRLGNGPFSFQVVYVDAIPENPTLHCALLLSYPEHADYISRLPRRLPFICRGKVGEMAEAFERGAAEYLCEPLRAQELEIRAARVLGTGKKTTLTGLSLRLEGTTLFGPTGMRHLSREEAFIFQKLLTRAPQQLARSAMQRYLWPTLGNDSRVVDSAVSRLRRYIRALCGPHQGPQIRSARRFGYYLSSY